MSENCLVLWVKNPPIGTRCSEALVGYTGEFSTISDLKKLIFVRENTQATVIVVIKYLRLSDVILIAGSCVLICDSQYLDLVTINLNCERCISSSLGV